MYKLHNYGKGHLYWTYTDKDGSTKTYTLEEFRDLLHQRMEECKSQM
jgi:hypothetical protein